MAKFVRQSDGLDGKVRHLKRLVFFLTMLILVLLVALGAREARGEMLHLLADVEQHHVLGEQRSLRQTAPLVESRCATLY